MPHHFSFSGCGFLGIYHLGVAACLKQHVPSLLEDCKIAGASAGSFVACCLLTGCSIGKNLFYYICNKYLQPSIRNSVYLLIFIPKCILAQKIPFKTSL